MGIKRKLVDILESVADVRVVRELPHGVSVAEDIEQRFLDYQVALIFDVGANKGQSALKYSRVFPHAHVYCFEPVSETFGLLEANVQDHDRIRCFQLALGAVEADATMLCDGASSMNRLLDPTALTEVGDSFTERVKVTTLDRFCDDNSLPSISFLKIDAEGADLDVLKGARSLLQREAADFVEVEAGMNPHNDLHVPFEDLKIHLESFGYCVFGIYEQVNEWPQKKPNLRRVNAVFVSSKVINQVAA